MKATRKSTRYLVQASLIAAIYTALCLILHPISFGFGGVELRVSEALTLMPALMPAAVPGLFVGCLLANLMGGASILDIVFGSHARSRRSHPQMARKAGARRAAARRHERGRHRSAAAVCLWRQHAALAVHGLHRPRSGGRLLCNRSAADENDEAAARKISQRLTYILNVK